jgi:hypothetical protein
MSEAKKGFLLVLGAMAGLYVASLVLRRLP